MNFRRTIARSAILTMSLAVTAFASGTGRAALTPWMVAHAGAAGTCDLLPSNRSPKLGEGAADFMSTQPSLSCTQSTSRRLERSLARHLGLQHSLSNAPQLSAAVTLASATDLARPSRVLSRAEILAALATSASVNQFSGLQALRVEDIVSAPDILVAEATPQIEITRIEPDTNGTATRARLWIPTEPRIPPFWVTLHRAMTSPSPSVGANATSNTTTPRSIAPAIAGNSAERASANPALGQAVLIPRGKNVQLVMQATGIRITAEGTALEAGREGQRIRVRSEFAGKVVVATVLNADTVQLEY
jgi:hypothetical protein